MSVLKIGVIPGDGVGPEVTEIGLAVLEKVGKRDGLAYELTSFDIGGDMVFQLLLGQHKSAVPVIRDYIADDEKALVAKGF